MSDYALEVLEPENYILEVTTSLESNDNLELTQYDIYTLEIITDMKFILVSELPDEIPFTKIKKSGIDGVNYYLDHYNFDGGTP